ncbi:MAG: DNA polymerase III subunit delta [Bacilli bacterium]|nr:DNA polymerase III subunit delta [Bacilli bacterium]
MNNYLLESTDFLAEQNEIAEIIKKNKFQDSAISIYDLEETLLEKALEDLDTYSFLTTKKIIIIKNIETIKQEDFEKDLKHLYQYLENPNPDNLLIITSKKLNNVLKMTKELKKKCEFIQVSMNAEAFAKKELKDYKLEPGVLNLLLNYCKDDITKLKNECIKLKTYKFDEKEITKKDVEEMCVEKLGDSQDLTFAFSRSLAEKNKKEALLKYRELLNYNIEPYNIVGLLATQIRIIYQVKCLEEKGMSNTEIANTLGKKPFYIQKTSELTRYFTLKELLELIIKLESIDIQIKTSDIDPNSLIELFILNI